LQPHRHPAQPLACQPTVHLFVFSVLRAHPADHAQACGAALCLSLRIPLTPLTTAHPSGSTHTTGAHPSQPSTAHGPNFLHLAVGGGGVPSCSAVVTLAESPPLALGKPPDLSAWPGKYVPRPTRRCVQGHHTTPGLCASAWQSGMSAHPPHVPVLTPHTTIRPRSFISWTLGPPRLILKSAPGL
jgi:hypothetical protein